MNYWLVDVDEVRVDLCLCLLFRFCSTVSRSILCKKIDDGWLGIQAAWKDIDSYVRYLRDWFDAQK